MHLIIFIKKIYTLLNMYIFVKTFQAFVKTFYLNEFGKTFCPDSSSVFFIYCQFCTSTYLTKYVYGFVKTIYAVFSSVFFYSLSIRTTIYGVQFVPV